jgi:pSer/pThr/pTyr-binding forkhead associated (FHA) protein
MAKLILSLDDLVLQDIPLTKERTTIGRKPHNDIHIDNLAVSGDHAVIVTIMNDCILEDLGSTNGTLVNGVLAKKHILQNNDVIELGKYKLKFLGVAARPPRRPRPSPPITKRRWYGVPAE